MASTTFSNPRGSQIALGRLLWIAPLAGLLAAAANLVVFFAAQALGVDVTLPLPGQPPAPLPAAAVIGASIVPALGAGVLLAVLGRFTTRALPIFIAIAVVFGLASLGGPLTLPIGDALKATLALMHVVAAVVITGLLVTRARA